MATRKSSKTKNDATTANLGFEAKLWAAAVAFYGKMDSWTQHFTCDHAVSSSYGARTTQRSGVV